VYIRVQGVVAVELALGRRLEVLLILLVPDPVVVVRPPRQQRPPAPLRPIDTDSHGFPLIQDLPVHGILRLQASVD